MEIGLGTSQLRSLGRRLPVAGVADLLEAARGAGVRYVDTSNAYGAGSAERALGAASRMRGLGPREFRIITKLGYRTPDLPGLLGMLNQPVKKAQHRGGNRQSFDVDSLSRAWASSRRRLGHLEVHACCLHNPSVAVLEDGGAVTALTALRDAGAFGLVGVSADDDAAVEVLIEMSGVELVEMSARAWIALPSSGRASLLGRGVEVVVNRVTDLDRDPLAALRILALGPQPPTVAVVGTRSAAHLIADAAVAGA